MSFILGVTVNAMALESPWKRVCRENGGLFWVLNVQTPNEIPLCLFGDAAIGAESYFNHKQGDDVIAVRAYLNSESCAQNDGRVISGVDTNHKTWSLCLFADNSLMEVDTLDNGPQDSRNSLLTNAL
jgi:hypothetical protein